MHVTCMSPSLSPQQRFGQNGKRISEIAVAAWGWAEALVECVPLRSTIGASTRDGHPSRRRHHPGPKHGARWVYTQSALSAHTPRICGEPPTHSPSWGLQSIWTIWYQVLGTKVFGTTQPASLEPPLHKINNFTPNDFVSNSFASTTLLFIKYCYINKVVSHSFILKSVVSKSAWV